MSDELARLYQSLELKVQEKTRRLQQANETLEVLYRCSQALSVRQIDQQAFENVLRIVRQSERLRCIRLNVADDHGQWQLNEGEPAPTQAPEHAADHPERQTAWRAALAARGAPAASSSDAEPANMLGRGVYFNRAQKQHQYLLLMEERATIARELHDSLAQTLSFLRIQLTLLRRAADTPAAKAIIDDFDRTLADAYRQLRELLATFRLNIQEADLNAALEQLLQPLKALTPRGFSYTVGCLRRRSTPSSRCTHCRSCARRCSMPSSTPGRTRLRCVARSTPQATTFSALSTTVAASPVWRNRKGIMV